MSLFFRKKNQHLRLACGITPTGINAAVMTCDDENVPQIAHSIHCPFNTKDNWRDAQQQITAFIEEYKLQHADCYGVFSEKHYQLILLDAPNVPEEEQLAAVRWKIKDLIAIDIDDTVIDIFPHPTKKMLYAAVSDKALVQCFVNFIRAVKLNLMSIDIEELACRNVFERHPCNERGVAVVLLRENEGKLLIFNQSKLYLSRRFNLHYDGDTHNALPEEELMVELQRSLDYYERQVGQTVPRDMLFCGKVSEDQISSTIKNSFQQRLAHININDILHCASSTVDPLNILMLSGAALRGLAPSNTTLTATASSLIGTQEHIHATGS